MSETRPDPADPRHPIKVVARRTGLTPDVLRVWEKRYRAVSPTRLDTGRRLYSDADVERLLLLRRATLAGRRIGQVAKMPNAELEPLVVDDETAMAVAPRAIFMNNNLSDSRLQKSVLHWKTRYMDSQKTEHLGGHICSDRHLG